MTVEFVQPTNEKRDYDRFFIPGGDPDFNPERNKYLVEKTIRDYEAIREAKRKAYEEAVGERSAAAMSFARHLDKGGRTPKNSREAETAAQSYFGRSQLAELRGQQILQEVQENRRLLGSKD